MIIPPKRLIPNSIILSLIAVNTFSSVQVTAQTNKEENGGETEEVIVVSRSEITGTSSLPVTILSGDELVHRRQGGLGETLAGLPGIHLDNFGGGASRPVIRGQTVPRIEVLSDGATLYDASAVSPDHAITTDPLLLRQIEVISGPAAVLYGGNAMNGAINLLDNKIPSSLPDGKVTGAVEGRLGIDDMETTAAGHITAGVGQFAVHAEGSARISSDYEVPDEFGSSRLQDSYSESSSQSVGMSWITDQGYIGAAFTVQEAEYGLPGHSHLNGVCHTHGRDLHCAAHGEYNDPFGSSDDHTAYIDLRSERTDVRADFVKLLPGIENTSLRLSYTDYKHDEVDGPALFSSYTNEVYDGRLELTHTPLLGFTGSFGVQYTDGTFTGLNINDLHQDPGYEGFFFGTVPPYDHVTENIGVFLSEHRAFGAVDVDFAIRHDKREITLPEPGFILNIPPEFLELVLPNLIAFFGPDWENELPKEALDAYAEQHPGAEHELLSASLGATWNFSDSYSASLSFSHSERAPSVRELYAYGNNLATNSYELGLSQRTRASSSFPENTTDVTEAADTVNLTFRKAEGPTSFEISVFHQDIDDYIFARLIETETETGVPHNYLMYVAEDATFFGFDGFISHQLNASSSIRLFGDYVRTDMKSQEDNLPRIPPARLGAQYKWTHNPMTLELEFIHTFDQDRFASYETETDSYNLFNATFSYRFETGNSRSLDFYIRGSNLFNELAYVHTSFVKEQSPLRGRSITLGVRHQF